jgi:hypothetical protein
VVYCSTSCQKEDWKQHKTVCTSLRAVRKNVKKEQEKETTQEKVNMFTDATGTGSVLLLHNPSKESVLVFNRNNRSNQGVTVEKVGEHKFKAVDHLPAATQLLLSCGFLPNLERVRRLLPLVPLVSELRVPGAGFTALDWAARKGNFDIAKLLCTSEHSRALTGLGAPVGWACYTNRVELAKMLVLHGANPAQTDQVLYGQKPPAFVAAENGSLLALKWLHEEVGQDLAQMRDSAGRGILKIIERSRVQGNDLTPSHVACAKYARLQGATC